MRDNLLKMDIQTFGKYFDHTLLKPSVSNADFELLCKEGINCNAAMLAINSAAVGLCKRLTEGHNIHVGAAIGFPLGQTTVETKVFETMDSINNGADEIDYVINIVELKSKNYNYIKDEMERIVTSCREHGIISKVIFENCYLDDDEKKKLCEIANHVKPDFIKTSTGFGTGGAATSDVALMRAYADYPIKIKASGGIKTFDDAAKMIEAGAERIGTSSTVAIMGEFVNLRQ
ncbi:MAG: deoxyribose-phosphate aldolase [Defluviitaleaceae bacterium]|nr:deoxyribose-phosphate aldolase [Defluviitaleaceae bacterium]